MNVTNMMNSFHGNEIYTAAYMMDQAAVERIESAYQESWDNGEGFTVSTMFGRKADSDVEKAACAGQMLNALKDLIIRTWLSQYSREEICTLCGLLLKSPGKRYTRVRLVSGLEVDLEDIPREWNKLHPNETTVRLPDPDYI